MLYYHSERTDANKTNGSKECMIFNYWYLLDRGYKYEPEVRHGISMMAFEFENIAILNLKGFLLITDVLYGI